VDSPPRLLRRLLAAFVNKNDSKRLGWLTQLSLYQGEPLFVVVPGGIAEETTRTSAHRGQPNKHVALMMDWPQDSLVANPLETT
jgi:hypothetical protein